MSDLPITLVVAAAENNVIGRGNALPWHLPADLKHFKERTMGQPILMGRRTYESIGRPLPGRTNIVLTRDATFSAEGVQVVGSFDEARALANDIAPIHDSEELMVIGGGQVYAIALPLASGISLTRVHLSPEGDTHLPPIDWSHWREYKRIELPADETQPACTFFEYRRVAA